MELALKGGRCETTREELDYFEVVLQGGTAQAHWNAVSES
jgi:hypothetical protein